MDSRESYPGGLIADFSIAREMAHAEKPFRDQLLGDSRHMTADEIFAIGSKAGEASVRAYCESQRHETTTDKHDVTATQAADTEPVILTLYSPIEDASKTTVDEIAEQVNNRVRLGEMINGITDAYSTLFHLQIPQAGNEPRQPIMSKLRQRDPAVKWETCKVVGCLELAYTGTTGYRTGETRNSPTMATVDIRNVTGKKAASHPVIRFTAEFGDTTIERVRIRGYYGYQYDAIDVHENFSRQVLGMPGPAEVVTNDMPIHTIGDLLDRTAVYGGTVDFDITGDAPTVTITHPHTSIGSYQYRYNASNDLFSLVGLGTYIPNDRTRPPIVRPPSLSREEFLSILSSTFRLVPADESKI